MDKIDRLLDAMEHPKNYSSSEIVTMLKDSEVKEVFDLLDKTKSSLQTITTPNIEAEWKRFEEKQCASRKLKKNWVITLFSRNVAASITIAVASFTAMAAIVGVGIHHLNDSRKMTAKGIEAVAESKTTPTQPDTIRSVEAANVKTAAIIVFDDALLETILNSMAEYYNCEVVFNNEASKSLRLYFRWNQDLTVEETVERLNNFEQIKLTVNEGNIRVD